MNECASDPSYFTTGIAATCLTGMQHNGSEMTRAQKIGKVPIRNGYSIPALIFPEQHSSCLLVISSMPNIVQHVWLETHQGLTHALDGDDILDHQVQKSCLTRLSDRLFNGGSFTLHIHA